jgi:hypothetical protein
MPNKLRLLLSSMACCLREAICSVALKDTELARGCCDHPFEVVKDRYGKYPQHSSSEILLVQFLPASVLVHAGLQALGSWLKPYPGGLNGFENQDQNSIVTTL